MTSERHALGPVAHRGVVDELLLAVGQVDRVRALLALDEPVAQPDVAERAAHHHLVVAAAGAVRVELERRDAVLLEPLPGRRPRRDRAGRRDVVGRDRVAEDGEDARAVDVASTGGASAVRPSKNGGLAMYVEAGIPGVAVAGRDRQRPPAIVALEHDRVGPPEELGVDRVADDLPDLVGRGPDVGEEDGAAVGAGARAARAAGRCRPGRRARTRRRAAARRGSSPARADGSGPRSCGCPTGPPRRRGRSSSTACATGASSGPELPMQVVQP